MPIRVLIADDSDTVRGLIRAFLERRGNVEVCGEACDGRATINFALALRPDLLILDVVMPELNGIEVASILKERLPGTKTILFTMYGESIKSLALAAGVHAILPKPEGIRPLIQAVDSLLN
jgi:DNA-binding NarL/FixJ family response regulator